MKLASGLSGVLALALASSAAVAFAFTVPQPLPAPAQGATCGGPGQPACPLQAWMRANIAAPAAANNSAALASALEKTAGLAPEPSWGSWRTFALQGAAAAKRGDMAGARTVCKQCHDAWREAYKAKYRTRPIPR